MRGFIRRNLDPADRLGEIVFGLIMALGFTSAVRLGVEDLDNRELFLAILGCNLAWAVVDGVMYVMVAQFQRGLRARLRRNVLAAPSEEAAFERIGEEFDETVEPVTTPEERREVYRWVLEIVRRGHERPRLWRADLLGGVAVAAVILISTFPVLVPFLVFRNPDLAVRISHLTALGLMFVMGAWWGRVVGIKPWKAGAGVTLVGLVLVLITVALGG